MEYEKKSVGGAIHLEFLIILEKQLLRIDANVHERRDSLGRSPLVINLVYQISKTSIWLSNAFFPFLSHHALKDLGLTTYNSHYRCLSIGHQYLARPLHKEKELRRLRIERKKKMNELKKKKRKKFIKN